METFWIKAIQLILSLSILVVLHELGHFIPAKLFKTRVEKFYLFFDVKFSLFKKKIGETVYGIGWLPLGGYVKIAGMIDESMDKEQMAKPPQPWEFRSKPAWQRLIIMLGGVTVNIIVGIVIYIMVLFVWGTDYIPKENLDNGLAVNEVLYDYGFQDGDVILSVDGEPLKNQPEVNKYLMLRDVSTITVEHADGNRETIKLPEDIGSQLFQKGVMFPFGFKLEPIIDSVLPNQPGVKAGLAKGDKLLAVDGKSTPYWDDFTKAVAGAKSDTIQLTYINSNSEKITTEIVLNEDKKIGIAVQNSLADRFEHKSYSLSESISSGISYGYWTLRDYIAQFKYVFTKKGASQVGGFGAIGSLFPPAWDWQSFWMTTALISIILAFMNILPIPALDGGHVVFLLYEMVSGRKPNEKVLEYAQMIGFFLLIALVLYANGNDIYRFVFKD
ncbi:RIP metalloprotease RseP [Flavobacterium sp. CS20]|jgi:regulator of sigma E protease|uniref:RIP metalloprotease RseP n=1 Tax=Flavobacterium sp. CS20 TaxID=2775246 RepID=UPI001B39DC7F|nr:RIP metalloprotease RseP [Flavobacterium sp. CS20]QTY26265.1 RIP metalloprotease RseP [Flavobacterium sp. CS20]